MVLICGSRHISNAVLDRILGWHILEEMLQTLILWTVYNEHGKGTEKSWDKIHVYFNLIFFEVIWDLFFSASCIFVFHETHLGELG